MKQYASIDQSSAAEWYRVRENEPDERLNMYKMDLHKDKAS